MTKSEMLNRMDVAMDCDRLRQSTKDSYLGCVNRFVEWCQAEPDRLAKSRDERVSAYLGERAPNWSASSQNQHLCALVFFHAKALGEPLGKLPDWVSAKRPRRLPVWLTRDEAIAVLAQLQGEQYLTGSLMFGAGTRVTETYMLRRENMNWDEGTITIRDGKGGKDRTVTLPKSLVADLRAQDARAAAMWAEDRANGVGPVWVPDDLVRKYPNAGYEPGKFWLFPAHGLVRDKDRWGNVRHHISTDTFAKAVVIATRRAGVLKHVKAHVFRHSFACDMIKRGTNIRDLADLLGHANISTTQIYLHVLPKMAAKIVSPLDAPQSNIVPFEAEPMRRLRVV